MVISDYNAIAELINHGVAADLAEAAALALKAGVDMDMMANAYRAGLPAALNRGLVTMADIDAAVARVLTLKEQLGLFDDPYGRGGPESATSLAGRRQLAREIASGSVVLLKNDKNALPLAEGRLALIGPLADAPGEMRGCWSAAGTAADCVSVLAGLRFALPHQSIRYAEGVDIESEDESRIAAALALCDDADTIVLCLGEAANMSGEACSRAHPGLPGKQAALVEAVMARANGKKVIAILFSGRPLVVPDLAARVDALLAAWAPGSEAGNALADILTGRAAPSGRTPVSWPRAVGQIPVYFGERPTGRPANPGDHYTSKYLDEDNAPLFPFGHGLGYGDIGYSGLSVAPAVARESESFAITVTLTNRGARAATETVFLFVRDKVASVTRPLLELKGFQRKPLQPGESGAVNFILPASALKFFDASMRPVFEPGEIEILAGPSADRARLLVQTVDAGLKRSRQARRHQGQHQKQSRHRIGIFAAIKQRHGGKEDHKARQNHAPDPGDRIGQEQRGQSLQDPDDAMGIAGEAPAAIGRPHKTRTGEMDKTTDSEDSGENQCVECRHGKHEPLLFLLNGRWGTRPSFARAAYRMAALCGVHELPDRIRQDQPGSAQRAECQLGKFFAKRAGTGPGLHSQARALQALDRTRHGDGVAVLKTVRVEQAYLSPHTLQGPANAVRHGVFIVQNRNVDQENPARFQPHPYQAEESGLEEMAGNFFLVEGIQDYGVIACRVPAQKSRTIADLAIHFGRHVEIEPRDVEGHGIDVNQCDANATARQHGGQRAPGAADHQHMAGPFLHQKAEQGVNIFRKADAVAVGDALMVARLPIGDAARPVVFDQDDFRRGLRNQAWLASAAT